MTIPLNPLLSRTQRTVCLYVPTNEEGVWAHLEVSSPSRKETIEGVRRGQIEILKTRFIDIYGYITLIWLEWSALSVEEGRNEDGGCQQ